MRTLQRPPRRRRTLARAAAMFSLLAVTAVGASGAWATQPEPGVGVPPGNQNADVTVCHVPPGGGVPSSILTIPDNALGGHLGHGDFVLTAGLTCPATPPPPIDACPDDLNPGIQAAGTVCITPPPPAVDACPDEALNPGIQAAGTTCAVATPSTPDTTTVTTGTTVTTTTDTTPTTTDTAVAGEQDSPTTARAQDTAVAGATASGSLPFTGIESWYAAVLGGAMLLAGFGMHGLARRHARRSGAAA
ncbi:MAG: hypothetical protein JWM86_2638 [Thermoleophilia bacterium]|nr:hypothetical protein [Thermoleophilia bacterium]